MNPEEIEEERRLCYVGITRAEKELYLLNATTRTVFGRTNGYLPSRFLKEIPEGLIEELRPKRKVREDVQRHVPSHLSVMSRPVTKPTLRNPVVENWQVGDTAVHSKWGNGKVIELQGSGSGLKLKIDFPTQGVRLIMAQFAPVKRLEKYLLYHCFTKDGRRKTMPAMNELRAAVANAATEEAKAHALQQLLLMPDICIM